MAVNSFNAQNPPVTTKGDVFTFSTIPTRLGVGANNTVLTADSSTATGLKWAAASSPTFVGCAVRKTTNQSMTANVITAITWDAEDFDTDAFHSTSSNTSRFTVPSGKAGKYQIGYSFSDIGGGSVAGAYIQNYIYKNGSLLTGYVNLQVKDVIDYWVTSGSAIVDAAVGDYFEIFYKNSDEAPNIYGGYSWAYFYYLGA